MLLKTYVTLNPAHTFLLSWSFDCGSRILPQNLTFFITKHSSQQNEAADSWTPAATDAELTEWLPQNGHWTVPPSLSPPIFCSPLLIQGERWLGLTAFLLQLRLLTCLSHWQKPPCPARARGLWRDGAHLLCLFAAVLSTLWRHFLFLREVLRCFRNIQKNTEEIF